MNWGFERMFFVPYHVDQPALTYDYAVAIGRFSPLHNGHVAMLQAGFERAAKMIIMIGSAHEPRMPKNPWSAAERAIMIRQSLSEYADRLIIDSIVNHHNDNSWCAAVQDQVSRAILKDGGDPAKAKVCIVGREKDASSYYIRRFPAWDFVSVERTSVMGATDMRAHYFRNDTGGNVLIQANVPQTVYETMMAFRTTQDYADLVECHQVIQNYEPKYGKGPHHTADAVVLWRSHVLLIERKSHPGKNQMAFPGGFVERERLLDAMLRELTEETCLTISKEKALSCLRKTATYDDPSRDPRSHIISTVFGLNLDEFEEAPLVKARSDAKRAVWVPLGEALKMRERFFVDHYKILEDFVNANEMASFSHLSLISTGVSHDPRPFF